MIDISNSNKNAKESYLGEKTWKYEIPGAIANGLRKGITDQDYPEIKTYLTKAWQAVNKMMPEDFTDDELDDKISDFEFYEIEPNEYADEQDIIDNWDYELSDFYDFCDAYGVWIPLSESKKHSSSKSLKEAFNKSIPGWVKEFVQRELKSDKYKNIWQFNTEWDKAMFINEPAPDKWKFSSDSTKLEFFHLAREVEGLDGSITSEKNLRLSDGTFIFAPSLYHYASNIYYDPGTYNSKYRKLIYANYQKWKPFILDYGYIAPEYVDVNDIRKARADRQPTDTRYDYNTLGKQTYRGQYKNTWTDQWNNFSSYDKSGYRLDPDKYKRMLAKLRSENNTYAKNVVEMKDKVVALKKEVADIIANADIDKMGKDSTYYRTHDYSYGNKLPAYNSPGSAYRKLPYLLNTMQAVVYEFNQFADYVNNSDSVYDEKVKEYINTINGKIDELNGIIAELDWNADE